MHEVSLAENILQIIEEAAREQGFSQVRTVWMEIGQLSCVEKGALHFCFTAVADDTIAQHAKLEIIDIAGCGWCEHCGREVAIRSLYDACPVCGDYVAQVLRGDEMRIRELEVQ